MNCNLNCSTCPFAAIEAAERKVIVVNIVGAAISSERLNFSNAPVCAIEHRGYTLRFINFSGEDYHIGRKILKSHPDIVLNMVDSTNLEDSLRLTTRLIDMDSHVVMAFCNYRELLSTDHSIDYKTLGKLFGFPAMTFDGSSEDLSRMLSLIVDLYEKPFDLKKHVHVSYGADIDFAINKITARIAESKVLSSSFHDRYLAVRLLEDPDYIRPEIEHDEKAAEIAAAATKQSEKLAREYGEPTAQIVRKARHGFINGALQETLRHSKDDSNHNLTQKIDALITNRWLGLPLLILVLFVVFQATFALGAYPQSWIEEGVASLNEMLRGCMPQGIFTNMLLDGILQGVGAVLAFLPNIVIMFFFLSLLEDSGYMARAAFIMDKIMHRIGLHGRSFIPMLIGFGCNVPAIMAAKSIDDQKDRILTMLMIPFMSCSARLPVYLLFVGAFFAQYKALALLSIYVFGIILSIVFAFVMKHTKYFKKGQDDYVSELPPFRTPTWRNTGHHIWERVSDYLHKISTVILLASVVIWALEFFPADRTNNGANKEESYLAMIGKSISPVMEPIGCDWKMNVCLLTGLPAKEAIVSSVGILYHTDEETDLVEAMSRESHVTSWKAVAFIAFVLLYFPCIATIATLRREIGNKWAAFSMVNSLVMAWIVAFVINQIGLLFYS